MMSRAARRVIALVAAAVLALPMAPAAVATHHPMRTKTHCASLLAKTGNPRGSARVVKTRCFVNLAPAVRYAVNGAVVPDDITFEEIDEIVVAPGARVDHGQLTTIIGIHWEHVDRGGRDRIYFVKGTKPCSKGRIWQIGQLDAGWDRLISSAESFGGCGAFEQFRDARHRGPSLVCTPYCASFGTLNDEISSVRWKA